MVIPQFFVLLCLLGLGVLVDSRLGKSGTTSGGHFEGGDAHLKGLGAKVEEVGGNLVKVPAGGLEERLRRCGIVLPFGQRSSP